MKFALFLIAVAASAQTIVVHADRMLDGKGGIVRNATVTIEGGRIAKIGGNAKADYDLKGMTLMPGWIDAHPSELAFRRKRPLFCRPRNAGTIHALRR